MVPRSGSVGLVVGGQHLFMVRGKGYDMTFADFGAKFFFGAPLRRRGSSMCSVCPTKVAVEIVHTYVCFMESRGCMDS
jgi:hypothetical protein